MILASQSTSRAALLRAAGVPFTAQPAYIDEAAVKQECWAAGITAPDTAVRLAQYKARRVTPPISELVLAADQLLVCDGAWFDKPPTLNAARDQLLALRGRTHELVTATVLFRDGAEIWRNVTTPRLHMRPFSSTFLDTYLAEENDVLLTTVGAYRLEGLGIHLFDRIEGEHSAILGLPLLPLLGFLREAGGASGVLQA